MRFAKWYILLRDVSFQWWRYGRFYLYATGSLRWHWRNHTHDDVIKWKHFPRNWPFVLEIHRSPVNFPHKGQWRGALMFSLIYAWINDWVNNHEAGDLRRQHGHYDVIVMDCLIANEASLGCVDEFTDTMKTIRTDHVSWDIIHRVKSWYPKIS